RRPVLAIDRGGDGTLAHSFGLDYAAIARLSAGRRIKYRPIKDDAAALIHGEHGGRAITQVRIGAVKRFGRGHGAHRQDYSDLTNTDGKLRCGASSHAGTGRFLLRRKAGLNSLD